MCELLTFFDANEKAFFTLLQSWSKRSFWIGSVECSGVSDLFQNPNWCSV